MMQKSSNHEMCNNVRDGCVFAISNNYICFFAYCIELWPKSLLS